jgi:trigger factor
MKTEFTDVSETQKTIRIEIPSDVVDAEINKVARDYSRQARLPGFRPGKVPATVVKQRFREQILHDVSHTLIPKAVDAALQERGIEPVETPNIKDVDLREGQPLKFTAAIETVPPFDPGDLATLALQRRATVVTEEAIAQALEGLRNRAAKSEPVEGRPVADADTVVLDIERKDDGGECDKHENVSL